MSMLWRPCVLFLLITSCGLCDDPCHYHMSVNITDGTKLGTGHYVHDGIVYPENHTFQYTDEFNSTHTRGCLCLLKHCIRKCCPIGQLFEDDTGECVDSENLLAYHFEPPIYSEAVYLEDLEAHKVFGLVFGNPCNGEDRQILYPHSQTLGEEKAFFLQPNGVIFVPQSFTNNVRDQMDYCIEAWESDPGEYPDSNWTTKYLALVCVYDQVDTDDIPTLPYTIGMFISIPFLVATFLVYAIIPDLQNLHGKAIMSYVFALTAAYTFLLVLEHLDPNTYSDEACITFAFLAYFFLLLSFFWLNVMCFDIWWTFSGYRIGRNRSVNSERRRFKLYSLYAWGSSCILTGFCALMQFNQSIHEGYIKPNIGMEKCWFSGRMSELLYFYIPMAILIVCNLLLFASTAYKIVLARKDTAVLRGGTSSRHTQNENSNQRLNLFYKLFLVMGISWMTEWISFLVGGPKDYWIVTDLFNTLTGIFIFVIFVCTRRVKNLIFKKFDIAVNESTTAKTSDSSGFRLTFSRASQISLKFTRQPENAPQE